MKEAGIDCEFAISDSHYTIEGAPKLKFGSFQVTGFKQVAIVQQQFDKKFKVSPGLKFMKEAISKQYKEQKEDAFYHSNRSIQDHGHLVSLNDIPDMYQTKDSQRLFNHKAKHADGLKFWSYSFFNHCNAQPFLLNRNPLEIVEDKETFRTVLDSDGQILVLADSKHPHFQYLDKGHFFVRYRSNWTFGDQVAPYNYVITNEMTPESMICLTLIAHDPTLIRFLGNEVFLNGPQAKIVRMKMEKELNGRTPHWYNNYRALLNTEFDKIKNDDLLGKIISGELKTGSYNDIKLTADSASYEAITITQPGLLKAVLGQAAFDEATDIYTIWRSCIQHNVNLLNSAALQAVSDKDVTEGKVTVIKDIKLKELPKQETVAEDPDEDEEGKLPEVKDEIVEDENELAFVMKINGFDVKISRVPQNTRRYVNGRPIKMDELEKVCYRASCSPNQAAFDGFVKNVSQMSLEWHDALAEGVRVKIQDGMTYQELKEPIAPMASPKITFRREEGVIGIVVSETKEFVPIKFNMFLKELKRINRQTTGSLYPSIGYGAKTPEWARFEIGKAIKRCCTFTEKRPVLDEAGVQKVDDKGKKLFDKVDVCKITEEQARFVEKMARDYAIRAKEREEQFLQIAVKATGARKENCQGEDYWVVTGTSGKQYAIHAVNNQVKHFPEMRHICIVEPGHVVSTGGDATAARLYALRNDKRMTDAITTLR